VLFQIIPIRPNPRQNYQDKVKTLCILLLGDDSKKFRYGVFRLLGIPATLATKTLQKNGSAKFREHPQAKLFLHDHPADVTAIKIMNELDKIYGAPMNEIDHLRGAVGEVFSYLICKKVYANVDIEIQVQIDAWKSESIGVAGCHRRRGHCLQSKCSSADFSSIVRQHSDFEKIENLTKDKAECRFVTYTDQRAFHQVLQNRGIDPKSYKVFGRTDLVDLEQYLAS
jgi:hypothetical protein